MAQVAKIRMRIEAKIEADKTEKPKAGGATLKGKAGKSAGAGGGDDGQEKKGKKDKGKDKKDSDGGKDSNEAQGQLSARIEEVTGRATAALSQIPPGMPPAEQVAAVRQILDDLEREGMVMRKTSGSTEGGVALGFNPLYDQRPLEVLLLAASILDRAGSGTPVATKVDVGTKAGPSSVPADVSGQAADSSGGAEPSTGSASSEAEPVVSQAPEQQSASEEERRQVEARKLGASVLRARTRAALAKVVERAIEAGLLVDAGPKARNNSTATESAGPTDRRRVPPVRLASVVVGSEVSAGFFAAVREQDDEIASYTVLRREVLQWTKQGGDDRPMPSEQLREIFAESPAPVEPIAWTPEMVDEIAALAKERLTIESLARQLIVSEVIVAVDPRRGDRRPIVTFGGRPLALEAIRKDRSDEYDEASVRVLATIEQRLRSVRRQEQQRPDEEPTPEA